MTARRTPFIGLTGSVAAGKSEALAALGRLGAATLSSDAIVHEILAGDEFTERLVERWGERVAPDGTLDRAAIGAIVFEQPRELEWLESELHPRVGERIVAWRAGLSDDLPAAVVEVPLLFETGMEPAFDATIAIVATDELRTVRAGARGTGQHGDEGHQHRDRSELSHIPLSPDSSNAEPIPVRQAPGL
ncbi:MAG: dephospho-CoA kinase [Actinomycetota bacterium]